MSLTLEIITPEGVVWHGENLTMVTLPTTTGEVGIMSGHIPLITLLKEGAVFVTRENSSTESIAIDKGYARCMGDVVSILTEAAIDVSKLSDEDITQAKKMAEDAKQKASNVSLDADELEKLEAQIRFALAKELAKAKKRS